MSRQAGAVGGEERHGDSDERGRHTPWSNGGAHRMLDQVAWLLGASLDYGGTPSSVALFAARSLGELSIVEMLLDGDAPVFRTAAASPDDASLARIIEDRLGARQTPFFVPRVAKEGDALYVEVGDPDLLQLVAPLRPRSMMLVGLLLNGRHAGAIAFLSTTRDRPYDATDLESVSDLGRCASRAIEHAALLHRAELTAQSRDRLIDMVTHDLRNAVQAAKFSLLALSRQASVSVDRSRRPVAILQRTLTHMERLIADLRDARQIELGQFSVKAGAALAPADLVRSAVEANAAQAGTRRMEAACPTDLPPVQVDEERVLQVFANLIGNAIKFTPADGVITVGAEPAAGGHQVQFFVRDTGPGISSADQLHIFDWRWHARPAEGGGTGLGLGICRGIVEAHGGSIAVQSCIGAGTSFHFTLPVATSLVDVTAPVLAPRHIRVLVVEDDAALRDNLCEIVALDPADEALGVGSAEAALFEIGRARPDIIITDQRLPGMTGTQLVQTLRDRGLEIPAVIITQWIDDEEMETASQIGGTEVLRKPIDTAAFMASLRRRFEGHRDVTLIERQGIERGGADRPRSPAA